VEIIYESLVYTIS